MLSLDFIRNNKEKVKQAAAHKNRVVNIEKIIELDDKRRSYIVSSQKLREERNHLAKQGFSESAKIRGKAIKDELKKIEEELDNAQKQLDALMYQVPNVPFDEVPIGKNESGNVVVKTWGEPPQFDFAPKSHMDLGLDLDLIDIERGVKVSGFRGYFLKNQAAILHLAVLFYVFQKLSKKGYMPIIAPAITKAFTFFGVAQFPWGEPEVYKLNDDDAYLAGTAEVPVTSYYAGETLDEKDLPKKFVAFSPCFRREAGAYGKDTKGLYRLHEFWKVEQVIIAQNDKEKSIELHEELQRNTEEILEDFGIAYRKMLMCTGDMGEPQHKKYDTEIWMPSRNGYGEIASNSIMGDFQTRRLKIKYRKKDGTTAYCYSLNDTAVPSPRILIAILENYQQKDGSIRIPEKLQSLTGFAKIEAKK